ncbi:dienelactone hydrolase family protein [Sphingomonas quercus]|uniref:Dienelactone hydrolase family protein n=1 Tax=Sphingomonas quercus TaxID=2842451 RepID=A0ABS6BD49_9SPHN|nr:dienelactone hydrolase family protein [Sphingomonas quercus]MBU3076248.1 dienelactone hydrolase family protein [Sphingomonas quercus]
MESGQGKIPAEAVDLYTRFVHGEISRRAFTAGISRCAGAGMTAGGIIAALMPNYALAQQIRRDDERIRAGYETVASPKGNGSIRGYLVRPFSAESREATSTKLPGVLVIHENRGLNPHTEDVARRFALENFIAFAPDTTTSLGGYPGDDYKGGQMFAKIDRDKMTEDLVAAARWLKAHPGCNGRIAATGFCYGGGASNALAAILGDELSAAAPFYGAPTPAAEVPRIKAAILIHHGALDTRLAEGYPAQEAALKQHNIRHEGHVWPNSVHGFFNDATPERYNKVTAPQAWNRTIEWFNQYTRTA